MLSAPTSVRRNVFASTDHFVQLLVTTCSVTGECRFHSSRPRGPLQLRPTLITHCFLREQDTRIADKLGFEKRFFWAALQDFKRRLGCNNLLYAVSTFPLRGLGGAIRLQPPLLVSGYKGLLLSTAPIES